MVKGHQHYQYNGLYGMPSKQKYRDEIKAKVLREHGITLIEIPYWWHMNPKRY
jgi:hypothetical protein